MSIPGVVPLFIDNVWKSLDGTASLRPFINEIDIDKPLTFSSVASRIYGDMSNATVTNRLLFQTSIANSYTALGLLPSGSHDTSVFTIFNNSSPSNSSIGSFSIDADALSIQSGRIGGGTYLPIKFILGGLERININSSGFLGINESIPEAYLDIKGDIKLQNILLPTNTENKLYAMGNKLFWGNFLLSNLIEDEDVSNITTFSSNKILTVVEDISGELIQYIDEQDFNILQQSFFYTEEVSADLVTIFSSVSGGNLSQTLEKGNSSGAYDIDMNDNKVINLDTPLNYADATNKGYVDNTFLKLDCSNGPLTNTLTTHTKVEINGVTEYILQEEW